MNKELSNITYQAFKGFISSHSELNASFNLKYKACSLTGMGFFSLHKEQLTCKSSLADYIELKTTTGGKSLSLSIYRSTLLAVKNILALLSSNQDLNLANDDLKLNNVRTLFIP